MGSGRSQIEVLRSARGGLIALALAAVIFWVLYKGLQNTDQFVTVSLNGLTLACLYFVVASGFTLIFGLMRVVNMAHGSFYLLAGYLAFTMQRNWFDVSASSGGGGGLTFDAFGPEGGDATVASWIVPGILAVIAIGFLGLAMQQAFLRWNQGQELRQALITIAVSLIAADQMLGLFGGISKDIKAPEKWPETVQVLGVSYGFFRLVIVGGAALLIALLLYLLVRRTKFGMIVRAGVDDRAMVSALGINIQLIFGIAFFIGAALAGIGGVLGGTAISLGPGDDTNFLLNSLIVVIIGGLGSLTGAAVGAFALGMVDAYGDVYLAFGSTDLTNYSILVTFALLVAVLAVRPYGLFGRPA